MHYYINGLECISPQETFGENFTNNALRFQQHDSKSHLTLIEPNYTELIPRGSQRRMSRLVKTGVFSALGCIKEQEGLAVEGIIVGNGLGGLERAEVFLESFLPDETSPISPTPFMQSLNSAIAGQIALQIKCYGYSMTYAQKGLSFEGALMDALLMIEEHPDHHLLVGGIDEITPKYVQLQDDLNRVWKEDQPNGMMLGEGSSFILCSGQKNEHSLACIRRPSVFSRTNEIDINEKLLNYLKENNMSIDQIDWVISGECGTPEIDSRLKACIDNHLSGISNTPFKAYCGEYPTASSFALWMAVKGINYPEFASQFMTKKEASIKNVLIINQYFDTDFSFLLVTSC